MRFGSVGGGGRYDGLVARFRGEPVPATGFSIGVSRLLAALRRRAIVAARRGARPGGRARARPGPQSMADYQRLVAELRAAGIPAELYLGAGGMKAQMKYADRRRQPLRGHPGLERARRAGRAAGDDPRSRLGAELARATKDRADYLELRQRAQFTAPEAELVERVREVLARECGHAPCRLDSPQVMRLVERGRSRRFFFAVFVLEKS